MVVGSNTMLSHKLQISRLFRAKSTLTFKQLYSVDSLWKAYDMIITCSLDYLLCLYSGLFCDCFALKNILRDLMREKGPTPVKRRFKTQLTAFSL